jgi:DNA-binding NarL/FixJ family response regulator
VNDASARDAWGATRFEASVTLDPKGRIVQADRAARSLLALGQRSLEPGLALVDAISAASRTQARELAALLASRPSRRFVHRVLVPTVRPDGTELVLELIITPSRVPQGWRVSLADAGEDAAASEKLAVLEHTERAGKLGSWEWSPQTGRLVWSDNLYRLFSLEPGEIRPTPEYVLERTHPDDRERVAQALQAVHREGGRGPVEYRVLPPEGPIRCLRSTITGVADLQGRPTCVVGAVRDVTDELQAERKIAAHVAVADVLKEWKSLEQGGPRLLCELAGALGFDVGTLWIPGGGVLVPRVLWTARKLDASAFETETRRLRLSRGADLPGRAWEAGQPICVVDLRREPGYPRRDAAARAGLRGAVAVPALHGGQLRAVVELQSREPADLDARLMRSLRAIGYELGHLLAHQRVDPAAPALTERQLQVIRMAAQGCSTREIADRLFISPTTVKSHFESAYAKLGASDRASAVAAAIRYGVIE